MTSLTRTLSGLATAAMLAWGPALAQSQEGTTDGNGTAAQTGAGPALTADDTGLDARGVATGATDGKVDGAIPMQSDDSVLAGDLLGASVYNMNEESIGDINDMIVNLDGSVEGVIIGVGGFLGIGEKEVAIALSAIDLKMTEAGNPRLYLDRTAEELKAADAFVTAEHQRMARELEKNRTDALKNMSGLGQGEAAAQDAARRSAEEAATQ